VVKVHVKVKLSLGLIKHKTMTTYGGVEVQPLTFITSTTDGVEWSMSPKDSLNRRPSGRHYQSGENSLLLAEVKHQLIGCLGYSLVAILTKLS
jgi:hypothetical protein